MGYNDIIITEYTISISRCRSIVACKYNHYLQNHINIKEIKDVL